MTFSEILLALRSGKIVHWYNSRHVVYCCDWAHFYIVSNEGTKEESSIRLSEEMIREDNYKESDFYIGGN